MAETQVKISGMGPKLQGLHWESDRQLRLGRQSNLEVVLHDFSVDRLHAEIVRRASQWCLRDCAKSDGHPTLLNGQVVLGKEVPLRSDDVIQVGRLAFRVSIQTVEMPGPVAAPDAAPALEASALEAPALPKEEIRTTGSFLTVEARTHNSWDQALEKVAFHRDQLPQPGQALLTLLRSNHHLTHLDKLDDLLHSILADAIATLAAQRGSIILADQNHKNLELRAYLRPSRPNDVRPEYSKTLAEHCFRAGESMLCRNVSGDQDLSQARSVRAGGMSSIICAFLRSPRRKIGVLHLDRGPLQPPFVENDLYLADAVAASVAVGIETAQLVDSQREQFIQTVTTLARAVEMRDQYTGDHTRRVTDYSLLMANDLKLGALERYQIEIGTPLHDIGKIGIDDAVLRKPSKLSASEFEHIKTHTVKGADIVQTIINLIPMIPIVRHHHERWDGSGYPDGLKGNQISLNARIVAVADAFDAMTTDRPYRKALTPDVAFAELLSKAGSHFDPACVYAFVKLRTQVERLMRGQ